MSYYPPPNGSGTTYPYSAYHPQTAGAYSSGHPTTPGAYPTTPYQPYPGTAVTGYGTWPYAYSYFAQQQASQHAPLTAPKPPTPAVGTIPSGATTSTAPTTSSPAPQLQAQPQRTVPTPTAYTFTPSYTRESIANTGSGTRGRKQASFKGLFSKELRSLMYGFGDDRHPANDTVNVMEEILVEYIVDVCQTALAPGKKSRLSIEDIRRALSRPADAKKLARMEELLFMQEDIKRARAQFEESDMHQPSGF